MVFNAMLLVAYRTGVRASLSAHQQTQQHAVSRPAAMRSPHFLRSAQCLRALFGLFYMVAALPHKVLTCFCFHSCLQLLFSSPQQLAAVIPSFASDMPATYFGDVFVLTCELDVQHFHRLETPLANKVGRHGIKYGIAPLSGRTIPLGFVKALLKQCIHK